MTEAEARRVWLLRAFEQPSAVAPWTAADADAATRQALQRLGEHAGAAPFIAGRARLGTERLASREPAVDAVLAAGDLPRVFRPTVLLLAALAGAAADAVGSSQRINILAPPLFALLVWNLAVYASLLAAAVWPRKDEHRAGPLRRALVQRLAGAARRLAAGTPAGSPAAASALAGFAAAWWRQASALNTARLAGVLHAAAAVFALAAVASLYVRGLGFEYRAGWDSTFLTPAAVHRLLSLGFAPALAISGGALPDADALARLRFAAGGGENAARWIHLQALTVGLFVVLPRALLAAWAGRRARRLAAAFELPLGDPYFARLARLVESADGGALVVPVLPYSFQPPAAAQAALADALQRLHGRAVDARLAPTVPLGGEDEAGGWSTALAGATSAAVLFTLTATPERETHGAFVAAVASRLAAPRQLHVLVDEAAFRRRFGGADGAARLEPRREAWRRVLADVGAVPAFFDSDAA